MTQPRPEGVCLVVAPFSPIIMPALGVSTLKATLSAAGIRADVYYPSLAFCGYFLSGLSPRDAVLDYHRIAFDKELGNLCLSEALWEGHVDEVIEALRPRGANGEPMMPPRDPSWQRVLKYFREVPAFVEHLYAGRRWDEYELVGFSSNYTQNVGSLALARRIKERHPRVPIVFGGANCDGEMGLQLLHSFPQVDYVLQGEADYSLPLLVQRLREGGDPREVPGLVVRADGRAAAAAAPVPVTQMDALPYPDHDDYFEQLPPVIERMRSGGQLMLSIETSRGCWWGAHKACAFCGISRHADGYRSKSADRALAEMEWMRQRYGVNRLYATDSVIDPQYYQALLPRLAGKNFRLFYETRSNLGEHQVEALRRAGVAAMQPGVEGISSEILALLGKGTKGYQNIELLKWCEQRGMRPRWNYLYGLPGEPVEPYLADAGRVPALAHLPPPVNVSRVRLDRFSTLYVHRDELGYRNLRPLPGTRLYYRGLSEEERLRISYHFLSDLPQGQDLVYEGELTRALADWQARYERGAHFFVLEGEAASLLVDTRGAGRRAYLLAGSAHLLHRRMRQARRRPDLVILLSGAAVSPLAGSGDDWLLAAADQLGAERLDGPASPDELDASLRELGERLIVLSIDGRYLALAVDLTREEAAATLGFALPPGWLAANAARIAGKAEPQSVL